MRVRYIKRRKEQKEEKESVGMDKNDDEDDLKCLFSAEEVVLCGSSFSLL